MDEIYGIDQILSPPSSRAIERMAARLPRSSVIRSIASDVVADRVAEKADLDRLVQVLDDETGLSWREQAAAARLIPLIDLDAEREQKVIGKLVELLERRNWPDPGPRGLKLFTSFVLLAFSIRIIVEICWPSLTLQTNAVILAGCGVLFFPLLKHALGRDDNGLVPVRCAAAATLSFLRVPGSVDGLTAAATEEYRGFWAYGRERLRLTALYGLRRTLPELTDSHFGLLKRPTVPSLVRLLLGADETLLLEILNALGKVGDGRALSAVEYIAENGTHSERDAAVRILPVLRARRRMESDPKMLLRASEVVGAQSLLRPARHDPESDSAVLLRPTPAESAKTS